MKPRVWRRAGASTKRPRRAGPCCAGVRAMPRTGRRNSPRPMAVLGTRPAVPADADEIVAMVRELAEFEREPLSNVEASPADFLRDCFGDNPQAEVLIGEIDG